jgi:hypothetical protein
MNNAEDYLSKLSDTLCNKFKCSFSGTFRASNPVYTLPRPLVLPKNRNFEAALIYFATDNYLVNIDENNQRFIYSTNSSETCKTIKLAVGAYKLSGINAEIKRQMKPGADPEGWLGGGGLQPPLKNFDICHEK